MITRKKLVIGGGIAAVLIALGGTGAWAYAASNSPEKMLYSSLQQDTFTDAYVKEEALNSDGATMLAYAANNKDGYKVDASMTCTARGTGMGDLSMDIKLNQIEEKMYMNFENISIANSGDAETETAVNDYFKQNMAGKWIEMSDPEYSIKGYKEKGVMFGILGAYSKKMDAKDVSRLLQEHKVITINGTKDVTVDGKKAVEYDLSVRRSAYEKFMDDVAPHYPYKTYIVNAMFDNDNEEVTVTIDKSNKQVMSYIYSMANPCAEMMSTVDPYAATEMSEVVRIKNMPNGKKNQAASIAAPAGAVSEEAFFEALLSEAEAEL